MGPIIPGMALATPGLICVLTVYCFKNYINTINKLFVYHYSIERVQKMYRNSTERPGMARLKLLLSGN